MSAMRETSHEMDMHTWFAFQRLYESWIAHLEREQGWARPGRGDCGHRGAPVSRRAGRLGADRQSPTWGTTGSIGPQSVRVWLAGRLVRLALRLAPDMPPASGRQREGESSP